MNSNLGKWVLRDSNHIYGYYETKQLAEKAKELQLKKLSLLFSDFK